MSSSGGQLTPRNNQVPISIDSGLHTSFDQNLRVPGSTKVNVHKAESQLRLHSAQHSHSFTRITRNRIRTSNGCRSLNKTSILTPKSTSVYGSQSFLPSGQNILNSVKNSDFYSRNLKNHIYTSQGNLSK